MASEKERDRERESEKECTIRVPPIESGVFFSWFTPVLRSGAEKPLSLRDLPPLPLYLCASQCLRRIQTIIRQQADRSAKHSERNWLNCDGNAPKVVASSLPLLRVIFARHGLALLKISLLKTVGCALSFAQPLLLGEIVSFLSDEDESAYVGVLLVLALSLSALLSAVVNTNCNARCAVLKLQLNTALTQIVFARALSLPRVAWADLSLHDAQLQSFVAVDVERVASCLQGINDLWLLPAQIVVAFALLYLQIKIAFLAGVLLILLMIPLNALITKAIGTATTEWMREKDARVKILSEAFRSMVSVKMSGLDSVVERMSNASRERELFFLRRKKYLDAVCVFLWAATPVLAPFATFSAAVAISARTQDAHSLSPADVVTSIALLNALVFPMNALPWVVNGLVEARVSLSRLARLLNDHRNAHIIAPDLRTETLLAMERERERESETIISTRSQNSDGEGKSIVLLRKETEFSWARPQSQSAPQTETQKEKPFSVSLRSDWTVREGELWIVAGTTGAGKTALLHAVLRELAHNNKNSNNDLYDNNGRESENALYSDSLAFTHTHNEALTGTHCSGHGVSFSPQSPLLFSDTLRDNILCGRTLIYSRYLSVLRGAALERDLQGSRWRRERDLTRCDSQSVSGGQRLRISLARAAYAPSAVLLCDDPLSALDASTAESVLSFLAKEIVQRERRVVVLSTHSLRSVMRVLRESSLSSCVAGVLVLRNGRESERVSGTDTEAMQRLLNDDALSVTVTPSLAHERVENASEHGEEEMALFQGHTTRKEENEQEEGEDSPLCAQTEEGRGEDVCTHEGAISMTVYREFFFSLGPAVVLFTILCALGMQAASLSFSLYVTHWASHNDEISDREFLTVCGGIVSVCVVCVALRSVLFASMSLRACRILYRRLSLALFSASLSAWESLSAGAILNRIGRDSNAVDDALPFILNILLAQCVQLLGALALIAWASPVALVFLACVSVAYLRLQRFYRESGRALRRIDAAVRSPVFSLCSEALQNAVVVRAMHSNCGVAIKETDGVASGREIEGCEIATNPLWQSHGGFETTTMSYSNVRDAMRGEDEMLAQQSVSFSLLLRFSNALDDSLRASVAVNVASQWLSIRLQLLGLAVTFTLSLCLLLSASLSLLPVSASLSGLSLLYSVSLVNNLNGLVNALVETEQEMVSVERVLDVVRCVDSEFSDEEKERNIRKDESEGAHTDANKSVGLLQKCSSCCQHLTSSLSHTPVRRGYVSVSSTGDIEQGPLQESLLLSDDEDENEKCTKVPLFTASRGLVLQSVSLRYRADSVDVLRAVSVAISPGDRVLVVGRTGSGKSSLLRGLLRLNDFHGGHAWLGEKDLSRCPRRWLRERVGVIPQSPVLFTGTLRFNVDPLGRCSDEEVLDALRASHFVDSLYESDKGKKETERDPRSLLTMRIEDGGESLSHGQRQLLCLCRALLRGSDLFLIDELSASLDLKTKQRVYQAVDAQLRLAPQSILVMVSHHTEGLHSLCNKLLRIDDGQVIEFSDLKSQ